MAELLGVTDTDGKSRRIKIATYNGAERTGPVHIVYAGGLMADSLKMEPGTKTTALRDWTEAQGLPFTTFNYHAHGNGENKSEGEYKDTTLTRMFADLYTVVRHVAKGERPVFLIACSTSNSFSYDAVSMLNRKEQSVTDVLSVCPVWADALSGAVRQQYPTESDVRNAFNQFGFATVKSGTLEKGDFQLGPAAYADLSRYHFASRSRPLAMNARLLMLYGSEDRTSRSFVDMVTEKVDARSITREMLPNTGHAVTAEQTITVVQKGLAMAGYGG